MAATKYLDKTGLTYFWGKIKAWANAAFAAITHPHASSDVTTMTSYSKPNSSSAITTSDNLNAAIGKLEYKVDSYDDSNYVHKINDETIQGIKTFSNVHSYTSENRVVLASIELKHPDLERNVNPLTYSRFAGLVILDKNATSDLDYVNRLATLEFGKDTDGTSYTYLKTYNPSTTDRETAMLSVGWDSGIAYSRAPSTSSSRSNGNDIVTRDWIPNDTRIVHTTGSESIAGAKTFNNGITLNTTATDQESELKFKNNNLTKGTAPSSNFNDIVLRGIDKDDKSLYGLYHIWSTDGSATFRLICYKHDVTNTSGSWTSLACGYDTNGIAFGIAPSTSTSRTNGEDIVTRNFIPNDTRIVHTTGDETIGGWKHFLQTIKLHYGTIVKGTNPSSKTYKSIEVYDSNDAHLATIGTNIDTNGNMAVYFTAYKFAAGSDTNASLGIHYPKTGDPYTAAPTPATSDNSTKIATTAFVKAQGYLTSHQSLDSCVKTSGTQSIGGDKTFTSSIIVKRGNPYLYLIETDWEKGTPQSSATSYQGILFKEKNETTAGSFYYNYDQNKNSYFSIIVNNMSSASASGTTELYLGYNADDSKYFRAGGNGTTLLGRSGNRWKEIWCTQSSINSTSDIRLKQAVGKIPDNVLDAWESIDWVQYKFNEAVEEKGLEKARLHTGLIAQNIDNVFKSKNLDINKYGLFLYDKWEEEKEEKDKQGNLVKSGTSAGDAYGLRYVEVLCMEAAYQRRKNKILENRISELEKQVSDMLQILQSLKGAN